MSDFFPVMGPATAFLAALACGFVAVSCFYKIALNLLTVGAGETLSPDEDSGRYWTWPADRNKIVVQSFALGLAALVLLALTYLLASRAFGNSPHLWDVWRR